MKYMYVNPMELIMYDRISHSPDDLDPDNFFRSVHVHGSNIQLYEPGEQEPEDPEVGDDTQDYTIYFDNLSSDCDLIVEQNEYISEQLYTLNENIVVLNENIKIGIGFGFVLMVYIMIKIAYGIFNKVFNIEKW